MFCLISDKKYMRKFSNDKKNYILYKFMHPRKVVSIDFLSSRLCFYSICFSLLSSVDTFLSSSSTMDMFLAYK